MDPLSFLAGLAVGVVVTLAGYWLIHTFFGD
jgi:hypothetical protein